MSWFALANPLRDPSQINKRAGPLSGPGGLGGIIDGDGSSTSLTSDDSPTIPLPLPSISLTLPSPLPTITISPSNDPTISDSTSTSSPSTTSSSSSSSTSSSSSSTSTPSAQSSSSPLSTTSLMTSTSNGLVVTVTVVQPVGSLAPAPTLQPPKGFLQNKAQMGVVFAIVALIALALFGFLGYRFYKAGKTRQQHMLEDEAQKVASQYRTRIDDGDDDEDMFARRREMAQLPSLPSSPGHLGTDLFQTTAAAKSAPSSSSSHETRNPYPLERTRLSIRSESLEAYSQAESRRSTDTQTLLFSSTGSGTTGPKRSNTLGSSTLQRSPTSATSATSHSKKYYLSPDPFPPPLELPDTFGEDARPRTPPQKPLEDDQDYHAMMGRVLKITNE